MLDSKIISATNPDSVPRSPACRPPAGRPVGRAGPAGIRPWSGSWWLRTDLPIYAGGSPNPPVDRFWCFFLPPLEPLSLLRKAVRDKSYQKHMCMQNMSSWARNFDQLWNEQSFHRKLIFFIFYLPAYFHSLTSLVKTHFWMKNRDITCVWAENLSIRIFSMRRSRLCYRFFPYPMKRIVFWQKS